MKQLGKYTIVDEIGAGGMGVVYRAHDPVIGRDVAIKVIRERALQLPEVRERFYREARAAGRLSHVNVMTIHDVGEHDGQPYIVMEFLRGTDLRTIIDQGLALSLEQKLSIASQICEGLRYAHLNSVIHRDIKPDNIRVEEGNRVKIMDFGIARLDSESSTLTHASIGTPRYMSPEQIKGAPLDGRTDIFSFGTLLYELLAGVNPFSGPSMTTVIYKILHEEPKPIHLEDSTLSRGLQEIISKCLAKDVDQRYSDFDSVIQDLSRFLQVHQRDTLSSPAYSGGESDPSLQRRPGAVATHKTGDGSHAAAPPVSRRKRTGRGTKYFVVAALLVALAPVAYMLVRESASRETQAFVAQVPSEPEPVKEADTADAGNVMHLQAAALQERERMQDEKRRADEAGAPDRAPDLYRQASSRAAEGDAALQEGGEQGFRTAQAAFLDAGSLFGEAAVAANRGNTDALRGQVETEQAAARGARLSVYEQRTVPQIASGFRQAEQLEAKADKQLSDGLLEDAIRSYREARQQYAAVRRDLDRLAALRRDADVARERMQRTQAAVGPRPEDPARADAYDRAETLSRTALEQYNTGHYEAAIRSFDEANTQLLKVAEAVDASATQRIAEQQAAEKARDAMLAEKNDLSAANRTGDEYQAALDLEARADELYAADSFRDAEALYASAAEKYRVLAASPAAPAAEESIRNLARRVQVAFETEDMDQLRALSSFFNSYADFFSVAHDIVSSVTYEEITEDGNSATFTMHIELTYQNNRNDRMTADLPLVWTLERAGDTWKPVRVVGK